MRKITDKVLLKEAVRIIKSGVDAVEVERLTPYREGKPLNLARKFLQKYSALKAQRRRRA